MIPIGPAKAAPSKDQLIAALKPDLTALVATDVRGDVDREKVYQYSQARRFELYDRGKQYLVPVLIDNQIVDWTDSGSLRSNNQTGNTGRYDHVINVIRGDKQKFVAVLGQRSPVVKCVADRDDDEDAIRLAHRADLEAHKLFFELQVERKQRHLADALWKTGTVFGYTAWVADGAKNGTIEEPSFDLQDQQLSPGGFHCMQCGADVSADEGTMGMCPQCGAPLGAESQTDPETAQVASPGESKSYAKGAVEFALATVFEVTCPFYARDVKDLPWLLYEYDEHKGRMLGLYPQLRAKIQNLDTGVGTMGSGSSQATGTIARDTVSSPTATQYTARKNRVLYTRIWLQPFMYELIKEESARKMMVENFPTGCKLTLVADELVDLEEEKLDDHWSYCQPSVSQYIFSDPTCADFIGIQDLINDMHNIAVEAYERSVPWFLIDPAVLDPVQMRKHAALPGEMIPAKAGTGSQLSNSIWKAPTTDPSSQMGEWVNGLREVGREMTGVLPAIFGAEGPSQTAREAELRRNQALMQLGVIWAEMRSFWSRTMEQAIRLKATFGAAQGGDDEGAPEAQLATLAELADGKWHCEAEEAMPMTWGQRRDFYMFLVDKGPAAWQMFGLQDPSNLPAIQQALGMDDWEVPMATNRDKVYEVIGQLIQGAPQPNPQTGKIEPSIPIDIFEDDHQFSATCVKMWCQSDKGRTVKKTNPQGYSNVVAWGMAHLDLTMPDPAMGGAGGVPGPQATNGAEAAAPGGPGPAPHMAAGPHGKPAPAPGGPPVGTAPGPSHFSGAGNPSPGPPGAQAAA